MVLYILSDEREPTTKTTLTGKAIIQIWKGEKIFTDEQKPKEFSTTKLALQEMLKGLLHKNYEREREKNLTGKGKHWVKVIE